MRKTALLCIWAALLVPSCSTKEIGERPVFIPDRSPSADHGGLQITFAPRANMYNEGVVGEVFMDGVQLADDQSVAVQATARLGGWQARPWVTSLLAGTTSRSKKSD